MHIVLPVSVAPRALFALAYTPASLVEDSPPRVHVAYNCSYVCDAGAVQADICQLGMDQRKVNMLAREYCDLMKPKRKFKPVILSHCTWPVRSAFQLLRLSRSMFYPSPSLPSKDYS